MTRSRDHERFTRRFAGSIRANWIVARLLRIRIDPAKLVLAIAFGLSLGYAGGLIRLEAAHDLTLDARGRPVLCDFIAFWTAGREALGGEASSAYEVHRLHAVQVAVVGHPFKETLDWSYPPPFFFVAALLAGLPYLLSFLLWSAGTLAAHAVTVAAIARRREALLFLGAGPWVLTNLMSGQNGFLTASLVAAVLLNLEMRPLLSGILLGLLSYKPQFGILFPFALAFGGYWRTFAGAVVSTIFLNMAAGAVFGFDTLSGFLHALASSTQTHFVVDGLGWNKLESAYSLMRSFGTSAEIAWVAQGIVSALAAVAIAALWRSRLPYSLKAAGLAAAVPVATPYILVYDLAVLSVAAAFLFRHRPFDRVEQALLGSVVPCVLVVYLVSLPSALFAGLAVAAIVVKRVIAESAGTSYALEPMQVSPA